MAKKFTYKAQEALNMAKEYAVKFGHFHVGTEHLLLALLNTNDSLANKILKNHDITENDINDVVFSYLELSKNKGQVDNLVVSPRMSRIMQISIREAQRARSQKVGTEHLLLGIIIENEGVALQILDELGISSRNILADIMEIMENKKEPFTQYDEIEENNKQNSSELYKYGKDMTQNAKMGIYDPIIGREREIKRILHILLRRMKNNPVLTGEPGVGKTAIVEGIAQKIAKGDCPDIMKEKKIFSLDIAAMLAGAKYRGEFEDRLKKSLEEVRKFKNVILFIDEIHTLVGAGNSEGSVDAANILKPYLARGEIQLIGATTISEYRKYIEKDSAFERRFGEVRVEEPKKDELFEILKGIKNKYEVYHLVNISNNTLDTAIDLSERYITDRRQPDKSIDLIDEASAKVRLNAKAKKSDEDSIKEKLEELKNEKDKAIDNKDFTRAANIREEEKKVYKKLYKIKQKDLIGKKVKYKRVTPVHIREVISTQTGIPVDKISNLDKRKLSNIESVIKSRVIGQEDAVKAVTRAVKRSRVGLKDPKRPIGSFLFLGPTGVGKTELTRALAYALFDSESEMIRLDMSEYMEKHTVSKLIGSPPGYVGHEEAGQLTEAVRRKPYSILLFDEIEKAHYDVFNILLQILEDGVLTDSKGRVADFKNSIIVMTSNIGAKNITDKNQLGFIDEEDEKTEYKKMKRNVTDELKTVFKPEFLNRIDDIIVFHKLTKKNILDITTLMMQQFKERIKNQKIRIDYTDKVVEYIAKEGYEPKFGARPIRRKIVNLIENQIAEAIVNEEIDTKRKILIDIDGNEKVTFKEE